MTIVVGGHSRNIGKTSIVCGIIEGLVDFNWTAIKITQFGHGVCSRDGKPCHCSDPVHPIAVSEEPAPDPSSDSGRYLVAGAKRSFWVRTPAGRLAEAMPTVRQIAAKFENVIVESNSILGFLKPDRCVMVVDGAVEDFKLSSRRFLDRADIVVPTSNAPLEWDGLTTLLKAKRIILALAPGYRSDELLRVLRDQT